MKLENRESDSKPVTVHPRPHTIEAILRHVDPGPDDETERFVQAIYEDRRKSSAVGADLLRLERFL
jgi:hypothetical protein